MLSVLIPGGADLYVPSLGSDLMSRLLFITYGTAVAMLVFVAMGSTVTHGVEHGRVNSWAATAAATFGTLVAELRSPWTCLSSSVRSHTRSENWEISLWVPED